MRIYVASSWRNNNQPGVVDALVAAGHEVYDFRHPRPGDNGVRWSDIDANWKGWGPLAFRKALNHQIAVNGFRSDMDALMACDVCVLVLPCGRSAHLELGYAVGAKKPTAVLMLDNDEPELMYRMLGRVCTSQDELEGFLAGIEFENSRRAPKSCLAVAPWVHWRSETPF